MRTLLIEIVVAPSVAESVWSVAFAVRPAISARQVPSAATTPVPDLLPIVAVTVRPSLCLLYHFEMR